MADKHLVTKQYLKKTLTAFEKRLEKNFVTKDYLDSQNFVTKDYLDSQNFVTKDYLENTFRKSINFDIDYKIENLKQELEEAAQKRHSEILNKMDDFLKEVKDSREERVTTGKQVADHETRITRLEETVLA